MNKLIIACRVLAVWANLSLLAIAYQAFNKNNWNSYSIDSFECFVLFAAATINGIAIFARVGDGEWIALYFRRKALEEQIKVDALSKKTCSSQ